MGLGINYVILANHLVSLITSSTTDPRLFVLALTINLPVDPSFKGLDLLQIKVIIPTNKLLLRRLKY